MADARDWRKQEHLIGLQELYFHRDWTKTWQTDSVCVGLNLKVYS